MLAVVAACAALCLVTVAGANLWVWGATRDLIFHDSVRLPMEDIGLVLGTTPRAPHGRRNLFFEYRMDAAAELYHAGKVRHLLVSGGNPSTHYDEATDMRDALVARGVPASAITRDFAGYRTLDSVLRASAIFSAKRLTIISQPDHARRAVFIAQRLGIPAVGFAARAVRGPSGLKAMPREWGARLKAVLDLYVLNTHPRYLGTPEPIELGPDAAR